MRDDDVHRGNAIVDLNGDKMSNACDKCLNAPFCKQRTKCESDDGCYDFVETVKIDAKL